MNTEGLDAACKSDLEATKKSASDVLILYM